MTLYMMTTKDKYELPLAVADSMQELARITGANLNSIQSCLCHKRTRVNKTDKHWSKWHRVEVEDD